MSGPRHVSSLYRSPELHALLALVVAAGSLVLALLAVLARRSDVLMLDLREWRPSASRPFQGADRSAAEVQQHFDALQPALAAQRPFRLTLGLQPSPTPDVLTAGRRIPVSGDGPYCLRFFVSPVRLGPGGEARALVNGAVAASVRADDSGKGRIFEVKGIEPRDGRVDLRFELAAGAGGVPAGWSPAVHFEFVTLRACS
jgi:hypothetical protein